MNREMIELLISSKKNDEKIIKKLTVWFTNNSLLIDEKYLFDRNVFHLLIKKNKLNVIEALCSNPNWRRKALEPDKFGNTILHYAIKSSKAIDLGRLIKLFPELINKPNNSKNTPLHEAVLAEKIDAVKLLLEHPAVDRSIKNHTESTALSLARDRKELAPLFFYVDPSLITSLNLKSRITPETVDGNFRAFFPLMCSKSRSSPRSALSSSPRAKESTSSTLTLFASRAAENNQKAIEEAVIRARQFLKLIARAHQEKESSIKCQNFQHEFNVLCVSDPFVEHLKLSSEEQTLGTYEVISNSLRTLHPLADKKYSTYQKEAYYLQTSLIPLLLNNIQRVDLEPRGKPQIDISEATNEELLNHLWLLTAGQSDFDKQREINFAVINESAISLLSSFPLEKILIQLRVLYSSFDFNQKLIANFILVQLLLYSGVNAFPFGPAFHMQLRFFCKKNVNFNTGLAELGEELNIILQMAAKLSSALLDEPIIRNFSNLNRLVQFTFVSKLHSFDQLVDCAIAFPREERAKYVQSIANELRMLTMMFYQEVSICEFNNCYWSKEETKHLSPSIVKFTDYFNKLSFYFIEKILNQPSDNTRNALQFLIELSQALCALGEEKYPDLNHLQVLASVFSSSNISRLTVELGKLSTTDRKTIEEICTIASNLKNYQYMREICTTHRTALPFLGLFLTDVTFARDGNENALHRRAVVGEILKTILEIKLKINSECLIFVTDLPQFINTYPLPETGNLEDKLYILSRRIQPRKTDHIDFDKLRSENPGVVIDQLSSFLKEDILPSSFFDKKSHPPSQFAEVFISFFENSLSHFQAQHNDSDVANLMDKFQNAVENIFRINNTYYFPKKLSSNLNPIYYSGRIQELRKQVLTDSSQNQRKMTPAKVVLTSIKRKSMDPLKGYSLFSSKMGDEKEDKANSAVPTTEIP
ncbi:RasGEF domain-containing protein [Legionella micdadei]|uniref:Ankyrin repeat-containing protein n=1 Tax=Legionella micdadei TaxID=451 RepID=A0A098GJX7_LEGMI|nr:RasGEF domain-containing protein [Legionella micdadei]ARG96803.1 hypothetical protein B6N58_03490 [Legionella micdadei]KTD26476.1 RasGEF domain protein [Legionella micdadei]NSL17933.1 ankyrin repeat domain-containing protein [Legionella micdadei]CEG61806.1 protein of unknown function [ankyrin repeat] [Ras domain] [Legionella micdadei]SCY24133.1 Ankyrin repeat-containing protein [Legionella micdadei]